MLIFQQPVISGSLIQLGWAMLQQNKPIFILYNKSIKELPFLIQKADTLKRHRIHMSSLEEIGGIEGIPEWLMVNKYHEMVLGAT